MQLAGTKIEMKKKNNPGGPGLEELGRGEPEADLVPRGPYLLVVWSGGPNLQADMVRPDHI